MTDRELMQMALDALEYPGPSWPDARQKAAEALRARLAQHEPEPVAWADKYDLDREGHDFWVSRQANVRTGVPLYTAPPQREWQGLTEMEKIEIQMLKWWDWEDTFDLDGYTRAIEAKLKEKNSA